MVAKPPDFGVPGHASVACALRTMSAHADLTRVSCAGRTLRGSVCRRMRN